MCYEHTSLDRTRKESYCTRMVLSAAWALSAAWRGPLSNDLTLTCTRKQRTGGEARGALLRRARLHLYVSLESMSTGDHARPPAGPRAYPRVRRSSLACRRSRCRRCCPPFARLGSGGERVVVRRCWRGDGDESAATSGGQSGPYPIESRPRRSRRRRSAKALRRRCARGERRSRRG